MTHPLTNALAMRTAAISARWEDHVADNSPKYLTDWQRGLVAGQQAMRAAILALPLEADHAALLSEAVKVLRDDISAQQKRVMSGEQRFYAKNITNACSEMGGPLGNAVERLIAALSALETP